MDHIYYTKGEERGNHFRSILKQERIWMEENGRINNILQEEKERIREVLGRLLEEEGRIIFAYLHGSFAEGRSFRDIDIAVYVEESEVPREGVIDFEIMTSMKLETNVKLPVDIKVINYAPLGFQYYSTTGSLLMCRDDDLRVDFLTKIRSLYFDFQTRSKRFLLEMLHAE